MTSLSPPTPVSLLDISSSLQPWRSAYLLYIRNSSAANSAASSPPVPARISSTTFFSSFGSFGTSSAFSSPSSFSRLAMSVLSSSCASSRMSAAPALAISSVWAMSRVTVLYSRNRSTIGSISESALACFRYSPGSLCTWADPRSCISSSYCCSVAASLSNISSLVKGS